MFSFITRIFTFLIFLVILFVGCFFFMDGGSILNRYIPDSYRTTAEVRALPFSPENLPDLDSDAWTRAYRFIALKDAVNSRTPQLGYTKIDDIAHNMQYAIIASEDKRFYDHPGFDVEGMMRATLVNIQYGKIQEGASTITQQTVKNLFLTADRTASRKMEEILLALNMESRYEKAEILEIYLNTIYFGDGYYGINQASHGYFGCAPSRLSLAQSAMLAGIVPAPSIYSPRVDFAAAKKRQALALNAMVKNGYITEAEAQNAKAAPIRLVEK